MYTRSITENKDSISAVEKTSVGDTSERLVEAKIVYALA